MFLQFYKILHKECEKFCKTEIYILHICKCMCLSMHFASCKASEVSLDDITGSKEYEFVNEAPSFYGVSGIVKARGTMICLRFPPITFKCYVSLSMNYHCTTFCHIIICEKAKQHFNKCECSVAVKLSWCLPVFNIFITSQC